MKKIIFAIYPSLISIFPILFLFSRNRGELWIPDISFPLFLAFILPMFLFCIIQIFTKSESKASIITISTVILFYICRKLDLSFPFFIGVWIVLSAIVGMRIFRESREKFLETINKLFAIGSCILILFPIISIVTLSSQESDSSIIQLHVQNQSCPDVYYIILDEYAREDVLMMIGYDNSDFIDKLRDRDFYIANKSTSNYAWTCCSLPSSLNMSYVDFFDGMESL